LDAVQYRRSDLKGKSNPETYEPNGWVSMKVCNYKGLSISIMLRDEHCPPHVHVNTGAWNARFQFSFWHNDIELWDVVPGPDDTATTIRIRLPLLVESPS